MKGGTLQINWHDSKPVLTLDFHPLSGLLATGGADFDIKVCIQFASSILIFVYDEIRLANFNFQLFPT